MTQTERILAHLQTGLSITQAEAAKLFGCWRLGARIHEIREAGHHVIMTWENHKGGKHARYAMEKHHD